MNIEQSTKGHVSRLKYYFNSDFYRCTVSFGAICPMRFIKLYRLLKLTFKVSKKRIYFENFVRATQLFGMVSHIFWTFEIWKILGGSMVTRKALNVFHITITNSIAPQFTT